MTTQEQLGWESRVGKPAALAAFGTILLTLASSVYVTSALDKHPDKDSSLQLLDVRDAQPDVFVAGAALAALASLFMIIVLLYLYRAVKHRRPDLPAAVFPLAIIGPVLLAIAGLLTQLDLNDTAHEFVRSGAHTEARAEDLLEGGSVLAQSLGLSGALAIAFATISISQSAMRTGLLSRFLGVLGIVVGATYVLGMLFPGIDLVRLFWLVALGLIFLDRWPGGRGPAWETGEATEWPSAAQQRAEYEAVESAEPVPAAVPAAEGPSERTRSSRKRKKKRR
jgi:Domain of unknown function (DUF4386)